MSRKKSPYIRLGTFPIEEILEHTLTNSGVVSITVMIDGRGKEVEVYTRSQRYRLFAEKGVVCCNCGLKGKYFALECDKKFFWQKKYHFNLYGIKDGAEMMLTKDHIVPKSKGGPNKMENYQVMCLECNQRKGDR